MEDKRENLQAEENIEININIETENGDIEADVNDDGVVDNSESEEKKEKEGEE